MDEERRRKRREAYKRKKEWQATLRSWADFAEYIVRRKQQENGCCGESQLVESHSTSL